MNFWKENNYNVRDTTLRGFPGVLCELNNSIPYLKELSPSKSGHFSIMRTVWVILQACQLVQTAHRYFTDGDGQEVNSRPSSVTISVP